MDKIKITLEDWDHTCADGCCYDYGVKVYVNDTELEHPDTDIHYNGYVGSDVQTALHAVLKHLGYEVEFKNK